MVFTTSALIAGCSFSPEGSPVQPTVPAATSEAQLPDGRYVDAFSRDIPLIPKGYEWVSKVVAADAQPKRCVINMTRTVVGSKVQVVTRGGEIQDDALCMPRADIVVDDLPSNHIAALETYRSQWYNFLAAAKEQLLQRNDTVSTFQVRANERQVQRIGIIKASEPPESTHKLGDFAAPDFCSVGIPVEASKGTVRPTTVRAIGTVAYTLPMQTTSYGVYEVSDSPPYADEFCNQGDVIVAAPADDAS